MGRPEQLFTGLLLLAGLVGGWAYYRAQARQAATLAGLIGLDNRLMASNRLRAQQAKASVSRISVVVNKNRNQAADVAVLQQTEEIHRRTESLLATLHRLRQSWRATNGRTELGPLPAQLAQYSMFIREFLPDAPAQLATAGGLGNAAGAAAPKPAALALLTQLETQVRQLEAEALTTQAQKVGYGCDLCFDKIGAAALPEVETVGPGAVYQAQLLLAISASASRAQFSANGHVVAIDPATGQALVQFDVPAARPGQPDTVRAAWHGRVQLPWAAGDTVLETTVPYLIVKPRPR